MCPQVSRTTMSAVRTSTVQATRAVTQTAASPQSPYQKLWLVTELNGMKMGGWNTSIENQAGV
jgi:hypothetical protein